MNVLLNYLLTSELVADTSLPVVEAAGGLPGSSVAAIVVCILIIFIIAAVIIVIILWRRRQRQKAEEAARQTIVGPSNKELQPTHNGTWSGSFHGLWKTQTWRGAPEEDELALANGTEGTRSELHNTLQFHRYGNGFWSIWVII